MHTISVYMPHTPSDEEIENFKGMFDVIYTIYACPVCRYDALPLKETNPEEHGLQRDHRDANLPYIQNF
jgi:hypothetical protein